MPWCDRCSLAWAGNILGFSDAFVDLSQRNPAGLADSRFQNLVEVLIERALSRRPPGRLLIGILKQESAIHKQSQYSRVFRCTLGDVPAGASSNCAILDR